MKADDAKELRDLRKENTRLKRIVADQSPDIDMLKELSRDAPKDQVRLVSAAKSDRRAWNTSRAR